MTLLVHGVGIALDTRINGCRMLVSVYDVESVAFVVRQLGTSTARPGGDAPFFIVAPHQGRNEGHVRQKKAAVIPAAAGEENTRRHSLRLHSSKKSACLSSASWRAALSPMLDLAYSRADWSVYRVLLELWRRHVVEGGG